MFSLHSIATFFGAKNASVLFFPMQYTQMHNNFRESYFYGNQKISQFLHIIIQ